MNYVISIINPDSLDRLSAICEELSLPLSVILHGRGTAVQSMLDLLGIESTEKRVVLSVANAEKTKALITAEKHRLHIGVPGHGIVIAVPVKSIGGGKAVAYLNGDSKLEKHAPTLNYAYELIVAIASEGSTDMVMNAARAAGSVTKRVTKLGESPVATHSTAKMHMAMIMPGFASFTFSNLAGSRPKNTDWLTFTNEASVSTDVTSAMTVTSRYPMFPVSAAFSYVA